jgi:hypothetical protein
MSRKRALCGGPDRRSQVTFDRALKTQERSCGNVIDRAGDNEMI